MKHGASAGSKRRKETQVVRLMIELYCRGRHGTPKGRLCPECQALAEYAAQRVAHCPHMEIKTFCSNCKTHRYSGPRMLLHHPVMAVRHVVETVKEKKRLKKENC